MEKADGKFCHILHNVSSFKKENKMINISIIQYQRDISSDEPFFRTYWKGYWLMYIVDGKGKVNYKEEVRTITTGDIICLDLSKPHGICISDNSYLDYFCIGFDGDGFKDIYKIIFDQNYIIHPVNQQNIHQIFMNIFKLKQSDTKHFDIKVLSLMFQIFSEIVNDEAEDTSNEQNPDALMVNKVKKFIKENMDENISIDDMAKEAGYSKYQFIRIFQKLTGITPGKYLNKIRIEKAQQYLIETILPLDIIAQKVGFNSLSAFITSYKNYTGHTPGFLRKNISPLGSK